MITQQEHDEALRQLRSEFQTEIEQRDARIAELEPLSNLPEQLEEANARIAELTSVQTNYDALKAAVATFASNAADGQQVLIRTLLSQTPDVQERLKTIERALLQSNVEVIQKRLAELQ